MDKIMVMVFTLVMGAVLGLCGCLPHQYHLGASAGTLGFDRPVSDAESRALYAGVSWSPQQRAHEDRMEDFAMASLVANPHVDPLVLEALQDDSPAAEEEHIPFVPDIAETTEKSWPFLIWASAVLILATAAAILKKAGLQIPWFKKDKS